MKLPAGRLDLLALVAVLALGAWLRFQRLDLLEFKGDEAYAMHVVLRALDGGGWPQVGLVSSVKILNPPLFLYLLAPLFAISASPVFVCCAIATLNLLAVVIAWHVGRKYYGATAGTVAALLFAVSPWAVIYSRKIWAQDFVPLFAACVVWALHAVVFGGRRAAIFWVVLLVLLCPQVHFSGLALWGGVVGVLLWLRPKIDWRWAVGGLVAAVVPLLPYLRHQVAHNWEDVRRAARTIGGQGYRIPKGVVVDPQLGYALPRRDSWWQALWILNSGGMEDILGLSTRAEFDPNRIWPPREYFRGGQTDVRRAVAFLGDAILAAQRLGLLVALVWLAVGGGRQGRLLVAMTVAPVGVFVAARLWTVQSYFVVLYPALFLVLGAAAQSVRRRRALFAVVVVVAVANIWFVLDLFDFVGRYGGAHG
ncbi:MAG: hypothetical protein N3B01_08585, partial [Verrucomicrobiae bacterium]|nr:hypothetical protein [Verrucomicrobiae bacterium]